MANGQRRRKASQKVEVAGATTAAGSGLLLGAERTRDAISRDNPVKLKRVANKAGRFSPVVRDAILGGRPGAGVIAAGTLGGGAAYAAQKYSEASLHRENLTNQKRARRAEAKVRSIKSARQEPGILTKAYRAERHRKQAEFGLTAAGVAAGGSAVQSHSSLQEAKGAVKAADESRRAHATAGAVKLLGTTGAAAGTAGKYSSAAAKARAAHAPFVAPAAPGGTYRPRVRREGETQDAFERRTRQGAQRHAATGQRSGVLHEAQVQAAKEAHGTSVRNAGRRAGARAAAGHASATAAGAVNSTADLHHAFKAQGQFKRATRDVATHSRQLRGRAGLAAGLLGAAVVTHEAKTRKPARRIPYAF